MTVYTWSRVGDRFTSQEISNGTKRGRTGRLEGFTEVREWVPRKEPGSNTGEGGSTWFELSLFYRSVVHDLSGRLENLSLAALTSPSVKD